jgi:hypothetical protein
MEAKLCTTKDVNLLHNILKEKALQVFDSVSTFVEDKDTNQQRLFLLEVTSIKYLLHYLEE